MFPCKVAGCDLSFRSEKDLLNHHIHSLEHEYCKLCKTAFEDDDALLKHKITSGKHIACPVCSGDFHTRAGLDRHVRQMHAAEQQIVCVGCAAIFSRAGGLIAHYEFNGCPVIARANFLKDVERKKVVTAVLKGKPLEEGYGHDTYINDADGGAQRSAGIDGPGSTNSQASKTDMSTPRKDVLPTPGCLPSSLDSRHWPALQDVKKELDTRKENLPPHKRQSITPVPSNLTVSGDSKKNLAGQRKGDVPNHQLLPADTSSSVWRARQRSNIVLERKEDYVPPHKRLPGHVDSSSGPNLNAFLRGEGAELMQASEQADNQTDARISTHIVSSMATPSINTQGGSLATSTQWTCDHHHPEQSLIDWEAEKVEDRASEIDDRAVLAEQINAIVMDPTTGISQWSKFWNPLLSKYECPLPDCRSKFSRLEALQTHLNSSTHLPEKFRCPACLRLFKGITALTQHTESQSNSCHIRKSTRLAEFVGQSTGNYLNVEGTHKDGSIKYTAGVPLPRSKYTI